MCRQAMASVPYRFWWEIDHVQLDSMCFASVREYIIMATSI